MGAKLLTPIRFDTPIREHDGVLDIAADGVLKERISVEALRDGGARHVDETELLARLVDPLRVLPVRTIIAGTLGRM